MLQIRSSVTLDQVEASVRSAAQHHHASLTVVSHLGQPQREAFVFSLFHAKLYTALLNADIRFAGFLPSRIAAWQDADGVVLQALTPSEYCRVLESPALEQIAAPLDKLLQDIMEQAARPLTAAAGKRADVGPSQWAATEDQVNMRAALPQRVDYRGTKLEDEGGTGQHDSKGG